MKLEERPLAEAEGTTLVHNIAYPSGRAAVRKGTVLAERHLATLRELGHQTVRVAILEADDVPENEAASVLAEAIQTGSMQLGRAATGRINFRVEVDGLLEVDADRLLALNMIPGVTLATRPQHSLAGPNHETDEIATLKIIPYAIPRADLNRALDLARSRPGIIEFRPLPPNRQAALLLTGEPAVHQKLHQDFEPPIRTRLEGLGVTLTRVEAVPLNVDAIREAAARLAVGNDLLIIAGQTSIMDPEDTTPRALKEAGADLTVHGAPVEPGNLLSLAYFPQTPVMCAPGCARSLDKNIVDLILPRLLLGDRLERKDIAQFGLGGLLK
jgi:molybdenum cofactor cytidylyltransferase